MSVRSAPRGCEPCAVNHGSQPRGMGAGWFTAPGNDTGNGGGSGGGVMGARTVCVDSELDLESVVDQIC
jgi:hypothetical protein